MPRQGPTFIIAGAPRSGTTWLYELLDRHPEIYMAKPVRPEPKFFLVDELYARGIQHYFDTWFAGADAYRAAGEKSTNYLESAVVAERIHQHLPSVKLVFILREPAHRAYSNWAWSRMNGMETEDFETALANEEERERLLDPRLRYARPHAYFSRGLYAEMLRPYFALFPREQVLCVKFDDIIRKPGRPRGPPPPLRGRHAAWRGRHRARRGEPVRKTRRGNARRGAGSAAAAVRRAVA